MVEYVWAEQGGVEGSFIGKIAEVGTVGRTVAAEGAWGIATTSGPRMLLLRSGGRHDQFETTYFGKHSYACGVEALLHAGQAVLLHVESDDAESGTVIALMQALERIWLPSPTVGRTSR